jgi:hypothetical protein
MGWITVDRNDSALKAVDVHLAAPQLPIFSTVGCFQYSLQDANMRR